MGVKQIAAAAFMDGICFAMTMTLWTPYLKSLNVSQFYLGAIGSMQALVMLIFGPLVGSFGDILGRKQVVIQLFLIVMAANLLMIISSNLAVIALSRFIAAFGSQIGTILRALLDDTITDQNTKMAAMNRMGALQGLCFIVGPIVSGFLSELPNGPTYVFTIITSLYAICALLISTIEYKRPSAKKDDKKRAQESKALLDHVKTAFSNLRNINWPKYWDLFAIKLLTDLAINMFFFNNGLMVMKLGGNGKTMGYFMATMGVMGISCSLLMGKIKQGLYPNDKSGFKRLLHANFILIVVFVSASMQTTLLGYIASILPFVITRVLAESSMMEAILGRVLQQEKGSVLSALESTLALGGLMAPIASGVLSQLWGESFTLFVSSGPVIISAFLCYYGNTKSKTKVQ